MLLAAGPLALWGAWVLWVSLPRGTWLTGVLGGLALVTAGGPLVLKAWARPLAYLFAAGLVIGWFYAVGLVVARGWPYADWLVTGLSLVPGALFLIVCAGGVWVVYKQYRQQAL